MDNYEDSKCLALEKALDDENRDPVVLSFSFLKHITKEFSNDQLIGKGGFGSVYKGKLRNGMVAVKKLHDNIGILENNFKSEVDCLIKVKHKNIVRFLGYCSETQHLLTPYEEKYVWADVWQRLFCFEYLSKGSLADYLTEASSGHQWRVRYQIIKGICEAVDYLHQHNIIHMDLKPQNILMDGSMVPKIADFGLSRRFSEKQSMTITENIVGTLGYWAPEFLTSKKITFKLDIYSLGVIIIEILMGCRERPTVDKVLESWRNMFGTSESHMLLEQVKVCAEIGINCTDENPENRPAIQDIIRRLQETDISNSVRSVASSSSAGQLVDELKSMTVSSALPQQEQSALGRFYQHYRLAKKACKPTRISACMALELNPRLGDQSELLDVHPLELCFPFKAKKRIQCSLHLVNRTDRYVAYWIRPEFANMYTVDKIWYSFKPDVGPFSTAILNVTMVEQEQSPADVGMFEILMIAVKGSENDYRLLLKSIGMDPRVDDDLLKQVEELGGEVYATMLTTAVARPTRNRFNCQLSSAAKIVSTTFTNMETMDVHPTRSWILVGHDNYLSIWDYEKQATMAALDIEKEAGMFYYLTHSRTKVHTVRFIPQREWFVAGDSYGYIHVYTCLGMKEIKRFKAHGGSPVKSLEVHRTYPYLLSACEDGAIRVWNWDKDWTCSREVCLFSENSTRGWVIVKFNPKDTDTFTSHDQYGGLKVWSIYTSAEPIKTIQENSRHKLYDHEAGLNHVVTIANDCSLKIWDLQSGTHIHTLNDRRVQTLSDKFITGFLAVACHPTLPLIAAATTDWEDSVLRPAVRFWNSTNYRFVETVWCMSSRCIAYLGFIASRRLVIGYDNQIEVLEIDMESLACQQ